MTQNKMRKMADRLLRQWPEPPVVAVALLQALGPLVGEMLADARETNLRSSDAIMAVADQVCRDVSHAA